MATHSGDDNSSLYFIVGGLVVLAVIFGLLFYNGSFSGMSSGPDSVIERTTNNTVVEREAEPSTSSTEVEFGDDGVSATTTTNP